MTSYTLRKGNPATTRTDAVVIGVSRTPKGDWKVAPGGEDVVEAYGRAWHPLLKSMGFSGKAGEVLRVPTSGVVKAATLVVAGLGETADVSAQDVRRAAGVAARNVGNSATVALALPATDGAHIRAVVEGFDSGGAKVRETAKRGRRRGKPETSEKESVAEVVVFTDLARKSEATTALQEALVVNAAVTRARRWTNLPPNELNPATFAEAAVTAAKGTGVVVEILDHVQLAELGCGGILGVGGASATPPCLVKMTWEPKGASEKTGHVALVGKGITYDSGGLSIKPGSSMKTMKLDMGGAAAVISTLIAIAELDLPIRVTGYAPLAENMISGTSMRPGDVLSMRDGTTVEVTNTDAEGRLILADAIALAVEEQPDAICNIATLTGAAVMALGDRYAAFFGDDDEVAAALTAATTAGELAWPMPIPDAIRERVRTESAIADLLQHNFVRWGSASYAAAFVHEFAGTVPFVHLDIAGPAFNEGGAWGHVPSGATGYGVGTMLEWVRARTTR